MAEEAEGLKQQLNAVFEGMPRDLQQTILSSPHRAALLQGSGPRHKVMQLCFDEGNIQSLTKVLVQTQICKMVGWEPVLRGHAHCLYQQVLQEYGMAQLHCACIAQRRAFKPMSFCLKTHLVTDASLHRRIASHDMNGQLHPMLCNALQVPGQPQRQLSTTSL